MVAAAVDISSPASTSTVSSACHVGIGPSCAPECHLKCAPGAELPQRQWAERSSSTFGANPRCEDCVELQVAAPPAAYLPGNPRYKEPRF